MKKKTCNNCHGKGTLSVGGNDGIECWECEKRARRGRKSKSKGKRGERTVAKMLSDITGKEWRRTAQVRGKNDGAPDVECADGSYSNLWVEVKDRARWHVGCAEWSAAWNTTIAECGDRIPVMIWRSGRSCWATTVLDGDGQVCTYAGFYIVKRLTPLECAVC